MNNKIKKDKFMTLEITSENYDSMISEYNILVVDFWAPWCGPCKTLGPIVDMVASDNKDKNVGIGKVNVDEHGSLGGNLGVRSIPTIIFYKGGEIVNRLVGIQTKESIEEVINGLK